MTLERNCLLLLKWLTVKVNSLHMITSKPLLFFLCIQVMASPIVYSKESPRDLIKGSAYTKPSNLVDVENGRRLNLYCLGKGSPTVIFESGLTEPINNWGFVQPSIAQTTRACSYDRAGVGFSDPLTRPATSINIVEDLHRMLLAENIKPPYVLVGHSTGGLSARLFAHTYPGEVVGMVLIDPSDENQLQESRKLYPEKTDEQWQADISTFLQAQRDCLKQAEKGFVKGSEIEVACKFDQYQQLSEDVQKATHVFQMKLPFWQAQVSELESFYSTSAEQLRKARQSFGTMPLIVLTETRVPPKNISTKQLKRWKSHYDLWKRFHINQANLSSRGIHEIVPNAGHHIQLDNPVAVERAVLRVLRMADE